MALRKKFISHGMEGYMEVWKPSLGHGILWLRLGFEYPGVLYWFLLLLLVCWHCFFVAKQLFGIEIRVTSPLPMRLNNLRYFCRLEIYTRERCVWVWVCVGISSNKKKEKKNSNGFTITSKPRSFSPRTTPRSRTQYFYTVLSTTLYYYYDYYFIYSDYS